MRIMGIAEDELDDNSNDDNDDNEDKSKQITMTQKAVWNDDRI